MLDSYDLVYELQGINKDSAIAHAVQKDAVQNSMDAYDPNNSDQWTVTFELATTKPCYLAITDTGTFGLTGQSNLDENTLSSLSYAQYKNERLSRFEALGYANPDPRARGARGQGKFVFIGTSKNYEMLYETLRADGVYLVGHWITQKPQPLMVTLRGASAQCYLQQQIPQIKPLAKIGTRIIIKDPCKELFKAFDDFLRPCDLARYISETWWEKLLEGWKINIRLVTQDKTLKISPPKQYKMLSADPDMYKLLCIKNEKIVFNNYQNLKIKQLIIAYWPEELPEELRGIAIQRGGMKVMTYDVREDNEFITAEHAKHIFGWLILNEAAEDQAKPYENPTHYSFKKTKGSLMQYLLGSGGWLSRQTRRFAEEQLGLVPETEKKVRQEKLLTRIVDYINTLSLKLGYTGGTKIAKSPQDREFPAEHEPPALVRIHMPPFVLPGQTRKVKYGETITNIRARIINDSDVPIILKFELDVKSPARAKTLVGTGKKQIDYVDRILLEPHTTSKWYGAYTLTFDKADPPGKHTFEAQITALDGVQKGEILHRITRAIYLEVDPEAIGRFQGFDFSDFPEPIKKLKYYTDEEEKGLKIHINAGHPTYKRASEQSEQVKSGTPDPMEDYLMTIVMAVFVDDDLLGEAKLQEEKLRSLLSKDDMGIAETVLKHSSRKQQEMLYDALNQAAKCKTGEENQ